MLCKCLEYLCTLNCIPNRAKAILLIFFYVFSLFYIVFSISFVSSSNTNSIDTFPVDCKDFGKYSNRSYCSLVYFDYCASYRSVITNYTNMYDAENYDQNYLITENLQSFQVYF